MCAQKKSGASLKHTRLPPPPASTTAVAPTHTSFSVRAIGLRARDDAVLFLLLLTGRRLQDYLFSGAGDLLLLFCRGSCCEWCCCFVSGATPAQLKAQHA